MNVFSYLSGCDLFHKIALTCKSIREQLTDQALGQLNQIRVITIKASSGESPDLRYRFHYSCFFYLRSETRRLYSNTGIRYQLEVCKDYLQHDAAGFFRPEEKSKLVVKILLKDPKTSKTKDFIPVFQEYRAMQLPTRKLTASQNFLPSKVSSLQENYP